MAIGNYISKISKKDLIAKDTYLMQLTIDKNLEFIPGQFVTILVAKNTRRSYSISSLPGTNTIEIIGDTVAGGPGSQFFLNSNIGDEVSFLGPLGNFVYRESDLPAYFFATGTGVVPFISMANYALEIAKTTRTIKLIYGSRYQNNLIQMDNLNHLDSQYTNFELITALSKPDTNWTGFSGRITELIPQSIIDKNIHAYICGSNAVITDVKKLLLESNIPAANIFYEQFY
jgi:ferredoxin-NADP reductase